MSARILVVDDEPANVRLLEAKLQSEYFDVCTSEGGKEAIEMAHSEHPDLILLDVMMPGIDGFETCRRLKSDPVTRHIPVIMVTALDQREDRIKGLEAGADDFLTKPVDDLTLFARVRSLLRLKVVLDELRHREESGVASGVMPELGDEEPENSKVVIVTGDIRVGKRYLAAMPDYVTPRLETDPVAGIEAVSKGVDLLMVDLTSPGFDGLRICARVRSEPETRQLPILAIVHPEDTASAVKALDIGVNDVVHRPVDAGELNARVQTQVRRKRYHDGLRDNVAASIELAVTDGLTGLHNRRYMDTHLETLVARALNRGKQLSLLITDIDRFKHINDKFGHAAGDMALAHFARLFSESRRKEDVVARVGGEEFALLLPGTDLRDAMAIADQLCAKIGSTPLETTVVGLPMTSSFGVAAISEKDKSLDDILLRADRALYRSKRAGRNQVDLESSQLLRAADGRLIPVSS